MHYDIEQLSVSETTVGKRPTLADFLIQTQPVILFLKEEIEHSSELLHKLANAFNMEINVLSETEDLDKVKISIFQMTEALQNEDRIQQRLWDLITTLNALERIFDHNNNVSPDYLSTSILRQLKLGEMQKALAIKANIDDPSIALGSLEAPSLGDVDLF